MIFKKSLLSLLVTFSSLSPSVLCFGPNLAAQDTVLVLDDAHGHQDPRLDWWREAKFGMFIHWGLYSEAGGSFPGHPATRGNKAKYAEWIMSDAMVPWSDYETLAPGFNPTAFSADEIVSLAKQAGMKYIVVTAKHHDGFAMFKSADPYNIVDDTPFKRDPLKELSIAAQKQGIKLGFYYSQDLDWHAPGGAVWRGTTKWDPGQQGNFSDYIHHKVIPQLKELLTNYQPSPVLLWFDMPTDDMTPSLAQEIMAVIKKHPNVIINGRLGGGVRDNYGVSELMMERGGARGVWKGDTESCDSINTTWGYSAKDQEWKSTDFLIHYLVNSVSQGGNFLLNIGPDSTGAIPQPAIDRLKAVGKWMQVNSESIYGAGPTPFGGEYGSIDQTDPKKKWVAETAWRATTQPGKLYIHIFEWPSSNAFEISGQKLKVTHATLLADPQHHPLAITHNDQGYTIQLPAQAPDLDDSVLALDLQK